MQASALYALLRGQLRAAGVQNPAFEAGCLLEQTVGIRREELPLRGKTSCEEEAALRLLARRKAGEPLQYVLGKWDFMGLSFDVGPGVLIPRADTELLAETTLKFLREIPTPRVLELCTGSGCIAVSLAALCPGCRVLAADVSDTALAFARRNVARHEAEGRVTLCRLDMLAGPADGFSAGFDALVCNPPYIPRPELTAASSPLEDAVRRYEPHLALDGGTDGLDFYRAAPLWFRLLRPGGVAAFEIGFDQGPRVGRIFEQAGLTGVAVLHDLADHARVVTGYAEGTT